MWCIQYRKLNLILSVFLPAHTTVWELLNGFYWNLLLGSFKIPQYGLIWQKFYVKNILHGKMFVHFCIYLEQISLNVYQSRNVSNKSYREKWTIILCQTHFSIKQVLANMPELLQCSVFSHLFSLKNPPFLWWSWRLYHVGLQHIPEDDYYCVWWMKKPLSIKKFSVCRVVQTCHNLDGY